MRGPQRTQSLRPSSWKRQREPAGLRLIDI